jgi:hypothetical protein
MLGAVLTAGLAASPIALAGGATTSSLKGKVKKLQKQVDALQQQVQGLQLQPGPQGPQGPQGPAGSIGPDSVALGAQTTGSYVGSLATGPLSGLTGGAPGSEGAALSLGLDYSSTLANDPPLAANQTVFGSTGVLFEGNVANANETILQANVNADRTINLPNADGTLTVSGQIGEADVAGSTGTLGRGIPVLYRFNIANGADGALQPQRAVEVIDAWSVATSGDAGTWTVEDDVGNPITDVVDPTGDQVISRATTIDDSQATINGPAGDILTVDASNALLDANVFVLAWPK